MMIRRAFLVGLAMAVLLPMGEAAVRHTVVPLTLAPELDLDGTEKIFVGPVMLEPRGDVQAHAVDLSAVREFERYVRRMIKRSTRLTLLPAEKDLTVPTDDPTLLAEMRDFWTELGEKTGAELIVAASIDVAVLDRAGYTTEEYVSPEDGKTYFRQVLIEETGFNYDILLMVVNGATGEVVHREQITDFKERSERKLQEFTDMFSNLYNLDARLLGVFVPWVIVSKRYLYKG